MSETDQLALYRLWRPQNFSEVVAQEQIVYPLRQSVINGNFSHALLFSGTRGTGKTSLAKIFAKAINCLNPDHGDPCNACEICLAANDGSLMDISEIDAASHNSVDHMRRLTDEVAFTPLKARFKVYIIDEVHMLSVGAFNALLKTLEEPPSHAVFVMATTEPHRIPATIISRCQHFKFRRIPNDEIIERIRLIAKSIDLAVDESAFEMMATLSGGALRDAIGLLDQTRQLETTPITRDDVLTLAGLVPDRFLSETAEAILFKKPDVLLVNIQELVMSGRDLTRFVTDLGAYFRNLLVTSVSNKPEQLIQLRGEDIERMTSIAQQTKTSVLTELIAGLSQLLVSMRLSPDLRTTLEIGLIDLLTRFGTEIDITKADHSHEHRKQKASADTQQTDSPQAKPVPATEKPSDTVVETNADIEPHQSGESVDEDSLRTEPKIVSNNDTLPAEKEKDIDLPSDSDVQSSDT
ncbi:MAG: DNA polymerase III subunit gamma/tau, partial [Clostridiaceae bacterium]|nr:DNA polymerase III subunit gamma/tau [Clostridiaceae bacterium]